MHLNIMILQLFECIEKYARMLAHCVYLHLMPSVILYCSSQAMNSNIIEIMKVNG